MKQVEIVIGKKGEVKAEVLQGPGGAGCLSMIDEVVGGLGKVKETVEKQEMYVGAGCQTSQAAGGWGNDWK